MITSIELQVISKILTTENDVELDNLLSFDESYYSVFKPHITFIFDHRQKYGNIPDLFTFQAEFQDVTLVKVDEPVEYLQAEMRRNKQHILLLETFNKIKDLGAGDVADSWRYLEMQCDKAAQLDDMKPMDLVHEADDRIKQVQEFGKQIRIPTGFAEVDKLMYGGFSTVEELCVLIARMGSGKSWMCTKFMESAQKAGFPVAYYSPEMQASLLSTRFDTWREHFENSELFRGKYTDEYLNYIAKLKESETPAYIIEDKDMEDGRVSVRRLEKFVRKNKIKLLIIDGISYMVDDQGAVTSHEKYKNIATGLFQLSKKYGCAVVLVMQANRDTKDNKDDKGPPLPTIYNAEGSDHPCRVATQVFSMRQIFDKHILDIQLQKSRNANNQNPTISYSWDVNTGNMTYLPSDDSGPSAATPVIPAAAQPAISAGTFEPDNSGLGLDSSETFEDLGDDVEF